MSKDATIREIHHRVKNNLQTIAALLRLQGRRLDSPEARQAIEESERRIRSIAIVHETLSREAGDVVPLQRHREAARAGRRGDGRRPEHRRPLRGRGRRRRAARRGGDAARRRAERADAERGRPRVPAGRRPDGRRATCGSCSPGTTGAVVEVIDDGVGLPAGSRSTGRGASASRSCRRWSPASSTGRSRCTTTTAPASSVRIPLRRRSAPPSSSSGISSGEVPSGPVQARLALLGQPALAELAALLLGRAAPDAGFLVGGQRELQALVGSPGTRRRSPWRSRSGRAPRRWRRWGRRARDSSRGRASGSARRRGPSRGFGSR